MYLNAIRIAVSDWKLCRNNASTIEKDISVIAGIACVECCSISFTERVEFQAVILGSQVISSVASSTYSRCI